MIRMANCCRIVGMLLLIVAIVGGSSDAWGVSWGTVGSAGTVDDADTSIAVFSGSTVTVSGSVATATLDIRYNVTLPPSETFNRVYWVVRFRDNGASAQVILNLKRQNIVTGVETLLSWFDSNNYLASNSFQYQNMNPCCEPSNFGSSHFYYIEAALKKFNGTGNPGLSAIGLDFSYFPACE